jgi:hypothetical protein
VTIVCPKTGKFLLDLLTIVVEHLGLWKEPENDAAIITNVTQFIESTMEDIGLVASIVTGVVPLVLVLAAIVAFLVYRHYLHRNVMSMNFDNRVYRKTTEDQFSLEKNQYRPQRICSEVVIEPSL